MSNILENIFTYLDSIIENYEILSENGNAQQKVRDYIAEHKLCETFEMEDELKSLIMNSKIESEKQGFKYGFQLATMLFTETMEGMRVK